jgi:hypothetical protein
MRRFKTNDRYRITKSSVFCALACAVPSTALSQSFVNTSVKWVNAVTVQQPLEGAVNPQNTVFETPSLQLLSEWRPEAKISLARKLVVVAKPRFSMSSAATQVAGRTSQSKTWLDYFWREAYGTLTASEVLQFSYGLQNFQWGPTESFSPTNTIARNSGFAGDILSEPAAHQVARINFTPKQNINALVLTEIAPSQQSPFLAEESFHKQILGKLEITDSSATSYAAIVAGSAEDGETFQGAYFNLAFNDTFSTYGDAKVNNKSRVWYPKEAQNSGSVSSFEKNTHRNTRVFSNLGTRFSFGNGVDLRAEFIRYDEGYSKSQLRQSITNASTLSQELPTNIARYSAPGLELPCKNSLYIAQHYLDTAGDSGVNQSLGWFGSMDDGTGNFFASISANAFNDLEVFASGSVAQGQLDRFYTRDKSWKGAAGVIWNW